MVRFKNRYFLAEVVWDEGTAPPNRFDSRKLFGAIRDQVLRLFGNYGVGLIQVAVSVKYSNPETNLVLIRCPRDCQQILSVAIPHVRELDNKRAILRVLHIGGTIRSCRKYAMEHNKGFFQLLKTALDSLEADMEREEKQSENEELSSLAPGADSIPLLPMEEG